MTKLLLSFTLLLTGLILADSARAQALKWLPDKIVFTRHSCYQMDTAITVRLTNLTDTIIVMDGTLLSGSGWSLDSVPPSWGMWYRFEPHDTLDFILRYRSKHAPFGSAKFYATSLDYTLKDTLVINGIRTGAVLMGNGPHGEIKVFQGDTNLIPYTLYNVGTEPAPLDEISSARTLEGVTEGDILAPGDSLSFHVRHIATTRGNSQTSVQFFSSCTDWSGLSSITTYPNGAHWVSSSITRNLTGCHPLSATSYDLRIANSRAFPVTIDSFTLLHDEGQWTVNDNAIAGEEIGPGDTVAVTLIRQPNANPVTHVILHQSTKPDDTMAVTIRDYSSRVGFTTESDTFVVEMANVDSVTLGFDVKNFGGGEVKLTSVEEDSPYWEVAGFDTASLASIKRAEIRMKFLGTSNYGDYPVTMRVRATPCDTTLIKTIIASVQPLSVDRQTVTSYKLYPIPATTQLTIEQDAPYSFALIDMLGREVMSGDGMQLHTIDVSSLPRGSYFLRLEQRGVVSTRKVLLVE